MEEKDIITMSRKELKRLHVIKKVMEKELKQKEAAKILDISGRQIRRIVKAVRENGETGIAHKARGKPSNRTMPKDVRERVLGLYRDKYNGFGPTLATEKLAELNNLKISCETLRKWLISEGIWKNRRQRQKHFTWRERKKYFGEMVLLDGSHHDWLEERGPELVLMGYVDDATSRVFAKFYDYEGTLPAMDSFKEYTKMYGIPLSVYLDKHTTYKSNKKLSIEEELSGISKPLSQFERALDDLGVKVIHANSPQAKGRVERLFGTLQDRLIKEMRLKSIASKEAANEFLKDYLPKYNEKFSVKPACSANLHRNSTRGFDLENILAVRKTRTLKNDNTVSFNGDLYLIKDKLFEKRIIVVQRTDGKVYLFCKNKQLSYKIIVKESADRSKMKTVLPEQRKPTVPALDHPWRKLSVKPYTTATNLKRKEELKSFSLSAK